MFGQHLRSPPSGESGVGPNIALECLLKWPDRFRSSGAPSEQYLSYNTANMALQGGEIRVDTLQGVFRLLGVHLNERFPKIVGLSSSLPENRLTTLFISAVERGRSDVVSWMISSRADVERPAVITFESERGPIAFQQTPLWTAADCGHDHILRILLKSSADACTQQVNTASGFLSFLSKSRGVGSFCVL